MVDDRQPPKRDLTHVKLAARGESGRAQDVRTKYDESREYGDHEDVHD